MNKIFDLVVIGGGPAGLIAAGRAAEKKARVIILEKNNVLGKKLLLTGKGRCNITNNESNLRKLVTNYSENGKILFNAFSIFGPKETINFFETKGLKTKTERGKRVFPCSDKAEDVLEVLKDYIKKNNVEVETNVGVVNFQVKNKKIIKLILKDKEIRGKNYLISTGGKSFPGTGSTGDGYKWARKFGHTITELSPALVPIKIKENWIQKLQGLSLKNIEISIYQDDKKKIKRFGECLFIHFGLSGPIILDVSKKVGELFKKGEVKISIDLKPTLNVNELDERLKKDFKKYHNKLFKNSLFDLLPQKLIPVIIDLSNINSDKKANSITKQERKNLISLLKNLEMSVENTLDFQSSIVTSGGVSVKEIDPKTMKSKIIDNLFFAGEIIDIDGSTGGFNLQLCWTTGYLVGDNIMK